MSTLRATNIKNPSSVGNNIVLDGSGGVVISGVTTVSVGSTSLPSISPSGDNNTGVFFPSADTIAFAEGGTEVARFDSSGRLSIGTASASSPLHVQVSRTSSTNAVALTLSDDVTGAQTNGVYKAIRSTSNSSVSVSEIRFVETDGTNNNTGIAFATQSTAAALTERARIDNNGRLVVGTTSYAGNGRLITAGNTGGNAGTFDICWTGSRPTTADTDIGYIRWYSADNSSSNAHYANIYASSDGASSSGSDIPGRLVFSTTADGASSPTERARITQSGQLWVGTTTEFGVSSSSATGHRLTSTGEVVHFASATPCLYVGRQTDDGTIISIRQAGTEEGTISVSGSTVSYNGAHLSRWSQLPGGSIREEILRGTVLSNIDEMCAWGEEDNEQLNRMKVSDIEGDPNVSGVFQSWDDDDDTYIDDFYCAMTGDFIIRIAEGVTVQRGDLLMSAGDGTAKPQEDDIVRSKTVAKVTSTHVTCTYEDGSYCVPCVLMAC